MSIEEIEKVILLCFPKQITEQQVIGKMLLILLDHKKRLLKLAAIPKDKR
jgi:hypothetical protein